MNQKRRFTPEFKKEAVALVTEQDYTVGRAAASLGISAKTLHAWVTLARNQSDGVLSDDDRVENELPRRKQRGINTKNAITG